MAERELNIILQAKDLASKTIQTAGSAIQENFKKVQAAAGVASLAIVGFAAASLKSFASAGEEISNMAAKTGISTEALSGLKLAADDAGISMGAVEGAVKKMQVNLTAMGQAGEDAQGPLTNLGLTLDELKDLTPDEQLISIGNAIGQIQDPAKKTAAAMEIFGKAGTELLPIFADGALSMEEMAQKARELGVSFDEGAVQKALDLDAAMDDLGTSIKGATQQIAISLAPAITDLVEKLTPVISKVTTWVAENPKLTAVLLAVTAAVTGLIAILPVLAAGILAVTAVSAPLLLGVLAVGAAIALLIAGIVLLVMHWDQLKAKILDVWTSIIIFIAPIIENFKNIVINGIVAVAQNIIAQMTTLKENWSNMWNDMLNIVGPIVDGIRNIVAPVVDLIQGAVNAMKDLANIAVEGIGSLGGGNKKSTKKRAKGGPLSAGDVAVVGEGGAEVFVPDVRGMVIPSSRAGVGGSQVNLTISGNQFLDRSSAEKMGDMIIDSLRLNLRLA